MSDLTTTVDVPNCPRCGAPAVAPGGSLQDPGCNTCGLLPGAS